MNGIGEIKSSSDQPKEFRPKPKEMIRKEVISAEKDRKGHIYAVFWQAKTGYFRPKRSLSAESALLAELVIYLCPNHFDTYR